LRDAANYAHHYKPLVVSWGYEPNRWAHPFLTSMIDWNKLKLIRVSIQGCNSRRDVEHLLS
jgi:hypothetical protein